MKTNVQIFVYIFFLHSRDHDTSSKHNSREFSPTSRVSHGSNNRVSPTNSTPNSYTYQGYTNNSSYYTMEYQSTISAINHRIDCDDGSPSELIMINEIERPKSTKLLIP